MCHRTQIPTFLDAEPTRARPPDPRGPSTDVLCPSSLGMSEVTGQSQATLKSKSPMQSIDRLTFVFNHPASQPTFFISSCSFFKLRSREQRHRFSWSRFRRRFSWQTGPVDLGLVPTLGGNPAWIFGHFGLSIVRLSTRQSMGKSQKRPAADFSPSTIQKTIRKPACHEHVPTIDMLAGGDKQVRLENSKRSFRNRGGKNHAQTQTTNRNFDVNSGRSGERYEAEIQQSTK